jgi:hypothetical protein
MDEWGGEDYAGWRREFHLKIHGSKGQAEVLKSFFGFVVPQFPLSTRSLYICPCLVLYRFVFDLVLLLSSSRRWVSIL